MFIKSSLFKTNYLLKRAMDVALVRQEVIADNIANADTPGFKRSKVTFESQLKRALESEERMKNCPRAYLTNKKHFAFCKPLDYRQVQPRIVVEYDTSYRNDKNNVDIEKEMSDAIVNTLRYKALAESLKQNYRMLALVMR